jgi:threonine dehydrogenase-like Zn-dependent dehydrogenase
MKALVYHGPGKRAWEDRAKPAINETTDAVVKITTSTICGTDLHILKGDVPSVTEGRILGHEGIGVVEAVGFAVTGDDADVAQGGAVWHVATSTAGDAPLCASRRDEGVRHVRERRQGGRLEGDSQD